MNPLIETLNHWGANAIRFAWPMLWQSSVLIAVLFATDFALRRHIRAAVRHALWLVVLVKLLLPPSLALPTSVAWWLFPSASTQGTPPTTHFTVSYGTDAAPVLPSQPAPAFTPPPPALSATAWMLLAWGGIGSSLLAWLSVRWRRVMRDLRRAIPVPPWLKELFVEARDSAGLRQPVCLRLTDQTMSPAVCGLFRPVILLPRSLTEKLPPAQLRAVLLHELTHLRRGDVWVNCAQALVQIIYWWHPLLWFANARIRRVREEAVDDAVMLTLRDEAEVYAPTLLEVAKLAFHRPLASLGLVGILESRSALRQRIERLVNFRAPRKAGLTLVSLCGICIFSAVALPMGEAPPVKTDSHTAGTETMTFKIGRPLDADSLKKLLLDAGVKIPPTVYFYTDNGLLLVRGDKEQMALVYSAVLKLDGFSPKEIPGETKVDTNIPSGDLVREAKLDYEMGKLDEAEKLLASVLAREPQHQGAHYYMNLVQAAKTNQPTGMIRSPTGREKIVRKLNRIQFDRFGPYAGSPLSEIVRALNQQTAEFDSDKTGIRFFMAGNSDARQPTIDANTGLPSKGTDPTGADIDSVVINIDLTNVRLTDVLDGILLSANKPIQYSVLDNGIVFSLRRDPKIPTLETRTFKVDQNTFYSRLRSLGPQNFSPANSSGGDHDGGGSAIVTIADQTANISQAAKRFFSKLGLNLDPPKSVFFNDRLGVLFVRATEQDMDVVEKAVGVLCFTTVSGTTNLVTRTFKVDPIALLANFGQIGLQTNSSTPLQQFISKAGVDLSPPKSIFYSHGNGVLFVRASEQDFGIIEKAIRVLNMTPPQIHIKARFIEVPQETLQLLGTNFIPIGTANATGILTDANSRRMLYALEHSQGVETLAEPEVTTLSGRQTQMRAMESITVVDGINPQALTPPGVLSTDNTKGMKTVQAETGPVFDVIPHLLSDGRTLSLNVSVSVVEFAGYDERGKTNLATVYVDGRKKQVTVPIPQFTIRELRTNVEIQDGQTVVLSGGTSTRITTTKETEPVSGDAPAGEPRSRKQITRTVDEKKQLLVLFTATLVDAAGKRIHSDNEMPFTKNGAPPQ
jgi:beta-lactamase regulating signal transducer with metallopeptidase domain/type II secretory pathway component GspD/PulD (secretin)